MATDRVDCVLEVEIHGKPVPVGSDGHLTAVDLRHVVDCVPFRDWVADVDPRVEVFSLRIQSVDYFGAGPPPAGRVGFVKMIADATLRPGDGVDARFHGGKIPGIVFLRGGAVCMLLVLECASTGEKYVVCCRQPRLASCDARFLELPAGMLDGSGAFAAVAMREMEEETGIMIGTGEMVDMTALVYGPDAAASDTESGAGGSSSTGHASSSGVELGAGGVAPAAGGATASPAAAAAAAPPPTTTAAAASPPPPRRGRRGLYLSVGACDEFVRIFYCHKRVPHEQLAVLQGRTGGCDADEAITVELVKLEDVWRVCRDASTQTALFWREKLLASGQLKE